MKLWDGILSGRSAAEVHAAVLGYASAGNAEMRQRFALLVSGNGAFLALTSLCKGLGTSPPGTLF